MKDPLKRYVLISFGINSAFVLALVLTAYAWTNRYTEMASILLPSRPVLSQVIEIADEDADPVQRKTAKKTNEIKPDEAVTGGEASDFNPADYSDFALVEEPPVPLSTIDPPYPRDAEKLGIEGRVLLKVFIDEKGAVRRVEVLKSPDESLTKSCVDTLTRTSFRPARIRGKNRAVVIIVPIRFELRS